ncbi:MAG TPA: DUF92 domain-containing protein, partial [Gemmatimonadales bacterium]|nr:DUF92 domain-containing protein [Gemmatimonadales bacterium]
AAVAWRAGTLTVRGAAAAWSVGFLVLYGTNWQGGAVLAAFFISSNLVSRLLPAASGALDPKGDRRDPWQVYANGGFAALGGATGIVHAELGLWLVTCSLAAATADTWATSFGSRSPAPPRLIWSGRRVPAGTSGGVSPIGTLAAMAGAFLVSGVGAAAAGSSVLLVAATLIGFLGMLADSTVGALLQGKFHCTACNVASEWRVHRCGSTTACTSGLPWVNNDVVNFLATGAAAVAGLGTWCWFVPR